MSGKRPVTILGMMSVVVALALAFAALRSASDLWFSALYTFTVVVLLWAVIAARFGRGGVRAFWFGFAVFGWGFFIVEMGPWMRPFVEGGPERELGGLNQDLLTSRLVFFLVPYVRTGTDDLEAIDRITANTIGIAHLLITLALALGGGSIAILMNRRRRKPAAEPGNVLTTLSILAALGLGISLGRPGTRAQPTVPFFPPESRGEGGDKIDDFEAKWYSKQLVAMGQDPLWKRAQADREATVYRLLWLPSFDHPVCVRIDRTNHGARLHARVLDGNIGGQPGQVAIDRQITLNTEQWSMLQRHLKEAAFWEMPTRLKGDGDTDGDQLIVEGVEGGAYHVVDRWEPSGTYAALCRRMLDLTGLKVQGAWDQYHGTPVENTAPSPTPGSPPEGNGSKSGGV